MVPTMKVLVTFLVCCIVILCNRLYKRSVIRRSLPPGPKGWPIIGNFFDIPVEYSWFKFAELAKTYGDIFYFEILGQPFLVLNNFKLATEFLEKRSINYSSRPYSVMAHELLGETWNMAFLPYGEKWRRRRRALHSYLRTIAGGNLHPTQLHATRILLRALWERPGEFFDHAQNHAGTVILKAIYGYDTLPKDDPLVAVVNEGNHFVMSVNKGAYLVDIFPILKHIPSWFPGAGFKRAGAEGKRLGEVMLNTPFEWVKARMADKTAKPCLVTEYLNELEHNKDELPDDQELVIKETAGVAYSAGAETTASTLKTFILAMTLYPEVQKKAQAYLDSVVGRDRLPTFEDKQDLPYIEALMLEVMRWQVAGPLSVPHSSDVDDYYEGYLIPAGTIVLPNVWTMCVDEAMYPKSDIFMPERFMDKEGRERPQDPTAVAFGFGRRICPGRHLALDTVWIAIASILSMFDIKKAVDENGSEITPEIKYNSSIVIHPYPFKCQFVPRSEKLLNMVLSESDF